MKRQPRLMTAEELRIKPWERQALIKVRDFLRRHKPKRVRKNGLAVGKTPNKPVPVRFNMSVSGMPYECGTAMCVGGFMKLYHKKGKLTDLMLITPHMHDLLGKYVTNEHSPVLNPLFYPVDASGWERFTSLQGAKVIDKFLRTGDVSWPKLPPV